MADHSPITADRALKRRWIFPACALLLVFAAIGIDPALSALKEHYAKTPIGLRMPLANFDIAALASFQEAPPESPFKLPYSDEEVGSDEILSLRLQERGASGLAAQAYLVVTYYSNPEYDVPHTPEVCYRLLGATVYSASDRRLDLSGSEALPSHIDVRTVIADKSGVRAVIAFVFCANAQYFTRRNDVRLEMGMPGDKRWYFSKIEVVARAGRGEDTRPVFDRCLRLLTEALPELAAHHLPSRQDVMRRQIDAPHGAQ